MIIQIYPTDFHGQNFSSWSSFHFEAIPWKQTLKKRILEQKEGIKERLGLLSEKFGKIFGIEWSVDEELR